MLFARFYACLCAFFGSGLCPILLQVVLRAVFNRWLAAWRLAARFARVARFARLFVTLTSVRGGNSCLCADRSTSVCSVLMLVFCSFFSLFSWKISACVMCKLKLVLCPVRSWWLAASRLAARFARVARFASQARSARFAPKKSCLNYPVNSSP